MITLSHTTEGDIELPSPALNSAIAPDPYQTLARSISGAVRTFKHGPTKYQRRVVFESLLDSELDTLMDWLQAIGWFGGTFSFQFTDPRDSVAKEWLGVRLIEKPAVTRQSLNINDVSLTFESDFNWSFDSATNQ